MNIVRSLSIVLLLALAFHCKDDSSVVRRTETGGTFSLALQSVPAGITQVVARLSRRGYDDRILTLTMADSGASASGVLNDVPVGLWRLLVSALDDQGHVRYADSTNVDVQGGRTTQVALQLSPTTGDLVITVTWGGTCISPPPGLVSWWQAEFNARDAVGGNDGIIMDSATFVQGKVGKAFQFDGHSSYVRVPNSPSLNAPGSFTLEGWIYPVRDVGAMIVSKWGFAYGWENQRSYSLNLWPGRNLNFGIADDSTQLDTAFQAFPTTGGVLTLNAWNHVAAVYDRDAGARRIYVNGAKVAERFHASIQITQGIADVSIGAYQYAPFGTWDYFPGRIDEISFYHRALTGAEIKSIYESGSAGKCR